MPDAELPGLVNKPVRPPQPVATEEQIAELLARLRVRRRQLVNALAIGLVDVQDEPLPPSAVAPLAVLQGAIQAIEAEIGAELDDAEPDADRRLRDGRQVGTGTLGVGRAASVVAPPECAPARGSR